MFCRVFRGMSLDFGRRWKFFYFGHMLERNAKLKVFLIPCFEAWKSFLCKNRFSVNIWLESNEDKIFFDSFSMKTRDSYYCEGWGLTPSGFQFFFESIILNYFIFHISLIFLIKAYVYKFLLNLKICLKRRTKNF